MTLNKTTSDYWTDWLIDAVAAATQDKRFLADDPKADAVVIEAIKLNVKKAMDNFLRYNLHTGPMPLRATSVHIYMCDGCNYVHLALENEDKKVYTEAVLSGDMIHSMLALLHKRDVV